MQREGHTSTLAQCEGYAQARAREQYCNGKAIPLTAGERTMQTLANDPRRNGVADPLPPSADGTAAELMINAGPKTADDLLDQVKRANDADRRALAERMWEIDPDAAADMEIDDDLDDDPE